MVYLNRMSLLLFILGRYEEHRAGVETRPAKTGRRQAQGLN
jgi:cob(I)alamin adenosyltransferase